MTGRFTVLASGSSGNAALLETDGFGLLIDCGLHPRMLTARLREVGASWDAVNAVILTHIHGDHWKDLTLASLRSRRDPACTPTRDHLDHLGSAARAYESLHRARLTREYADGQPLELSLASSCGRCGSRTTPSRLSRFASIGAIRKGWHGPSGTPRISAAGRPN